MIAAVRVLAGFAVAPVPVIALLLIFGVVPPSLLEEALSFGYGAALLIGVPVFVVLEFRRKRSLASYVGATAIAIVLAICALLACDRLIYGPGGNNPFEVRTWQPGPLFGLLLLIIPACCSAATFWWIAMHGRESGS